MMQIIIPVLIIFIILIIRIIYELNTFVTIQKNYQTNNLDKDVKIIFISDLHCKKYSKILEACRKENPDYILVGGDIISKGDTDNYNEMAIFMSELSKIAKTIYAYGNHEGKIDSILQYEDEEVRIKYQEYLSAINNTDITVLRNEQIELEKFVFAALELPESYYKKRERITLSIDDITNIVSLKSNENKINILLAHNPSFADTYALLGFDYILSGHTHGGLVKLPLIGCVISPELFLFPKYASGEYDLNNNNKNIKMIISNGLGYHSYPIRLNCRQELICINFLANKNQTK